MVEAAQQESNRGVAYSAGFLGTQRAPARELPPFLDGERGEEAVAWVESDLAEVYPDCFAEGVCLPRGHAIVEIDHTAVAGWDGFLPEFLLWAWS